MDLFTHAMLAYLISFGLGQLVGVSEPMLLFAVVMAMVPDLDIFLYPLSYKYPVLSHRVGSHTFTFAFISALIGAGICFVAFGTPIIGMFLFGFLGASTHVLMDMVTNYAIPPFGPFSWKTYSLDIDMAVNPLFLVLNVTMIPLMWNMRGRMAWDQYTIIVLAMALFHIIYFSGRTAQRYFMQNKYAGIFKGQKVRAVATFNPFVYYIVRHVKVEKGIEVERYKKFHILGRKVPDVHFFVLDRAPDCIKVPIDSAEKAVAYGSVPLKAKLLEMERLRFMTAMVKEVKADAKDVRSRGKKVFEVFWFAWWSRFNAPKGLAVRVFEDGKVEIVGEEKRALEGLG